MPISVSALLRAAGLVAAAALLAGCQSPFARQETISLDAGDAVAWNKAVHTIDPWPVAASDTTIPVSGRRVAQAIENYESGLAEPAAAPSLGFVPLAPLAPGAAVPQP
jgi:hypothetical protein